MNRWQSAHSRLKRLVKRTRIGRWLVRKQLRKAPIRRQRLVNFVFQRILGINRDSPWSVHFTSRVTMPEQIDVGERVELSLLSSGGCYLQAGNGITIGDNTIIAPGVKIISANHSHSLDRRWIPGPPIRIGNHCWIGANAVILPGVELGDCVIVGAGAVVTKSFGSDRVIAGNPAREVGPQTQDANLEPVD